VATVVAVGALTLGLSVHALWIEPIGSEWLLLAGLTILTGSFSVKVPSINAYISVSEAFVFASVLLFGAEAGTVTVLLECLVILLWMKPQGRPVYRMFFNMAAPSVAIWTAGTAFYVLSGIQPYSEVFTPLPRLFVPLLAFTAVYFLLNSWLVAIAVGLETLRSAFAIWWKNFAWLAVNYFSGASLAALIVTYTQRLDFSTLAVIVPLLVVSYLTFRTAMGRAEDTYNHLAELNRLYLSTIETLAMAIDAKDQITHGHIRRVQTYAVGLAKRVGITDDRLLKAIEAAALLHDMGKLAVPEHILNKPGKLTPAEFEKMKLHAAVGADILSAIDFPYPVVPIVRHHHENWDGTGYPTGIRGTDIPIGARILSVVDCFDALTSDRPYRPKLSDDDALAILVERRGTMYDPLVVDTFIRVHKEIAPEHQSEVRLPGSALAEITTATTSGREPLPQKPAADEVDRPHMSARTVSALGNASISLDEALETFIQELTPTKLCVYFRYDGTEDHLVTSASAGEARAAVATLTVGLGERLSGWVGANRKTIINSDPALDLGEVCKSVCPPLTNTLAVPVLAGRELRGVLTVYGSGPYNDTHKSFVEKAAGLISERLRLGEPVGTNHATQGVKSRNSGAVAPVSSVLCIDLLNWIELTKGLTDTLCNQVLQDIAATIRRSLATSDLLIRHKDDEFVALLSRADAKDVRSLSRHTRRLLTEMQWPFQPGVRLDVSVDAVIAPIDPDSLWELLDYELKPRPPQPAAPAKTVH
jgi:putative nucleotidyltransferase with HDIG domain